MSDQIDSQEFASDVRDVFQGLKDEGYVLAGTITATKRDEDGNETKLVMDPAMTESPDYDTQLTEPVDGPTAHLAAPGPGAGVPAEAGGGGTETSADETDAEEDVEATDAAQEKADELGVDIDQVEGSGKDDRVLVSDVESYAAAQG